MRVPLLDLAAEYRAPAGRDRRGGGARRRSHRVHRRRRGARLRAGVRRATSASRTWSAWPTAPTRSSWRCKRSASAPGDAVLTVPFTFAAPLEAIVRAGATPLLVDIGDDFTLDVDAAAAILARQPVKAIIAVHLYGHPADLDRLLPLARAHGAALIEDAAQAHGAFCTVGGQRRRAGSVGDAGVLQLLPDQEPRRDGRRRRAGHRPRRRRRARPPARQPRRARASTSTPCPNGRNSRLDALQAAVLRVKLPHLDALEPCPARRRRALRAPALADLPLRLPIERPRRRMRVPSVRRAQRRSARACSSALSRARRRHGDPLPARAAPAGGLSPPRLRAPAACRWRSAAPPRCCRCRCRRS